MKKFLARKSACSSDCEQIGFDSLPDAVAWLDAYKKGTGTIYRNSTHSAIYQIENGKIIFDRRLSREK